jgi:hypothetical protein
MGGEPTLHPGFGEMIEEIRRRGRKLAVFSNAATPIDDAVLRRSVELETTWIVNCNPPATYRPDQLKRLRDHLALLGQAAVVTFNLTDGRTPFEHVFEYIEQYNLRRNIKLGIALPTLENRNVHAEWNELPAIATQVFKLLHEARRREIVVEFECGVPYCLFNEKQHEELKDIHVSHCGSRLDITPAGNIINCLPLARMASIPFRRFEDYRQAREWFQRMQSPYRQIGCTSACLTCQHRLSGICSACLAFGIGECNRIALPPLPGAETTISAALAGTEAARPAAVNESTNN